MYFLLAGSCPGPGLEVTAWPQMMFYVPPGTGIQHILHTVGKSPLEAQLVTQMF